MRYDIKTLIVSTVLLLLLLLQLLLLQNCYMVHFFLLKPLKSNLEEDDNKDQQNVIIKGKHLPLNNRMGFIRKRRKGAIIRYFWNNKEDTEHHVKTKMLLFHPFIN